MIAKRVLSRANCATAICSTKPHPPPTILTKKKSTLSTYRLKALVSQEKGTEDLQHGAEGEGEYQLDIQFRELRYAGQAQGGQPEAKGQRGHTQLPRQSNRERILCS